MRSWGAADPKGAGGGLPVDWPLGSADSTGQRNSFVSVVPLRAWPVSRESDSKRQAKINRLTTTYDSYQFSDAKYQALVLLAAEKLPLGLSSEQSGYP